MTDQAAPALKELFNLERLQHIASEMTAVYPAFDAKGFLKHAKAGLADLSVMQRMARVSESLHAVIPLDYPQTLKVLYALAPRLSGMGPLGATLAEWRSGVDEGREWLAIKGEALTSRLNAEQGSE